PLPPRSALFPYTTLFRSGPGLEIVGFQSIRDFPRVGEDFVREFRDLLDETGLVPTALGANADAGLRRDRMLTDDELVEYMKPQRSEEHTSELQSLRHLVC